MPSAIKYIEDSNSVPSTMQNNFVSFLNCAFYQSGTWLQNIAQRSITFGPVLPSNYTKKIEWYYTSYQVKYFLPSKIKVLLG